jgi:hypothetical protein
MKRSKALKRNPKSLKQMFYKEADMVMKRSQSTGQYLRNFNFLIENGFLKVDKPLKSELFFWKQQLQEFHPIPTTNSFVKNKIKLSQKNPKDGILAWRNDLSKIYQKLLKKSEQQKEKQQENRKLIGLPNQTNFKKCLEENDHGQIFKKVKVTFIRKKCFKFLKSD